MDLQLGPRHSEARAGSAAPAGGDVEPAATEVLRRPAGTTLRLLLLIAMVAMSAAFVGNWMFLSVDDGVLPTWPWLVLPPVTVLATAAVLTWLAPAWLERRHGWVPVPPERGAAALARLDAMAGEAGLGETPGLMWNPGEDRTRALAYGRPGRYRLALSPVLLGAARRRPAAFDPVVRHELAHVRHRDVAPAYFAIVVWYVLLVALAVPLLWRIVDRDLTLVPDYLVRVALLALVVAWVRADLLRTREGYADLRASLTAQHRQDLLASLDAAPPPSRRRPWHPFALHPVPAARAAVVRDPGRLGRIGPDELLAVGLTASWSIPLLGELLVSLGVGSLRAEQLSRLAVFALVGAYVAAASIRWAGTTDSRPGPLAPVALGLGLALGPTVSIAGTGLLVHASGELLGAALTGAVVAAYSVWVCDLSLVVTGVGRAWSRACGLLVISVAGCALALAATAMVPVTESVRLGTTRLVTDDPVRALASSAASIVLAIAVALVSLTVLLLRSPGRAFVGALTGVALGGAATLVVLGVRLRTDLPDDAATLRYYLATVLITAGAAAVAAVLLASGRKRGCLLAAYVAASVAVLVAAVGWVAVEDLGFGSTLGTGDLRGFLREAWPTGALLAAVPAALAWLLIRHDVSGRSHRTAGLVIGTLVALVAGVLTVALVPPVIDGPVVPRSDTAELRDYVITDVPVLLQRRQAALSQDQQALRLDPSLVAGALDAVVDQYDALLADVAGQQLRSPRALTVQADLRALLLAERQLVQAQRAVLTGTPAGDQYLAATERADRATYTWVMTYQQARTYVGQH